MPFRPSLGGVETVTELVADALVRLGHQVCVATMTPGPAVCDEGYEVLRTPSFLQLLAAYVKSDGVVLMGDSVRLGWPTLVCRKPTLMIHHMFPSVRKGGLLRDLVSRRCLHAAPSMALQQSLGIPCQVVPNPYDESCFWQGEDEDASRKPDQIIFVGRMIEEKGVIVLLDAVEQLLQRGRTFHLILVGDGPLRVSLTKRVQEGALAGRVSFRGALSRNEIAKEMRGCAIAVAPSLCEEAFGLTALEAVACGCAVVVSRSGGLPEAVGRCGIVIDKDDSLALAETLDRLLADPAARHRLRMTAVDHVHRHSPESVAASYVRLLTAA